MEKKSDNPVFSQFDSTAVNQILSRFLSDLDDTQTAYNELWNVYVQHCVPDGVPVETHDQIFSLHILFQDLFGQLKKIASAPGVH